MKIVCILFYNVDLLRLYHEWFLQEVYAETHRGGVGGREGQERRAQPETPAPYANPPQGTLNKISTIVLPCDTANTYIHIFH